MSLPCPVVDLIPQKGKMGFDQTLIKTELDDSLSNTTIKADNIFLADNDRLSEIVLVEYINQLNAAVSGYNGKYKNKPVRKGLFVGLQDAEFFQPVYLGDSLTLMAYLADEISQVSFVQGQVFREGEKIAELVTKLFEVKDSAEFDLLTGQGGETQEKGTVILNHNQPPSYLAFGVHRKLYSYLQNMITGADFISFDIACPADFDPFDGHFPGNPILPGITLLEISKLALQLFFGKPVTIKSIKKMKISGVVLPYQKVSAIIKIDRNNESSCLFSAVFKEGDTREISRFSGSCDEGRAE